MRIYILLLIYVFIYINFLLDISGDLYKTARSVCTNVSTLGTISGGSWH